MPDTSPDVSQAITGFHQDEEGQWVAELACGHTQHMRHQPPWQVRPWVTSEEGRRGMLGTVIPCRACSTPVRDDRPPR